MGEEVAGQLEGLTDRTLGDFVVRELIGQGGFGAVYRAEQPILEREAVIKVIARPEDASESSIARFMREARLASSLDHPFAAHIYAFGAEPDGLQWIAMELVRGSTLAELIATQGSLPMARFIPLFDRLCEVVHTAHEQGIVHRDIKPENVMVLSRAGRYLPKLLDLGIAKAVGGDGEAAPATLLAGAARNLGVTGAHGMLGSPRYMAPELWFAPQTAGASVDQYALGALAFEALTGEPAFPGETLEVVAMGHAKKPPPRLGEQFPPALADAIARALGKRPADRFSSVLEFAVAVREGSGLEIKPIEVPELDETLISEVQAGYPQPIVEAASAYLAASNAHQARDAIRGVVAAVTRYIGITALQCRSRLGRTTSSASEATAELLLELYRSGLSDRGWLDLATEVCRPFARRPDAFPIPELALALFPSRNPQAAVDPLADLEGHSGIFDGTVGADDAILTAVADVVPAVEALLRLVAFTASYPLVVSRGEQFEVLMGARATVPVKRRQVPTHAPIDDGKVILLDQNGAAVLALWPLVQMREPAPGQREELFLFEGPSRRGARLIARPIGFEISSDDLWAWFSTELLDLADNDNEAQSEDSPYLGMATFSATDADNFFGREREIETVANRLRRQSFVAVVGPSGAGKSSFVHAGVVPALRNLRTISVRPGANPIANLEARLSRDGVGSANLAAELAEDVGALGEFLRASASDGPILLVVDQFEEVFTMCRDDAERDRFIAALCEAASESLQNVRVAITLRDDFLMVAEKHPELRPKLARGLQLLGTPAPSDLRRILVEPAKRAGYQFEDPAIVTEMVDDVAELPGALPLLSFTAAKLWSLRDRHFKQLPSKAYRSLGGVVGALAQHAEDTLAEMTASERALVREAFRHLVTAEGTRDALTRSELGDVLGGGDEADSAIEKLIGARILVASESERGDVMIEVIHEALLSAWPRLVEWRREDAEGARLRDQLRAAARQWDERGRPAGLLWRGDALTELSIWRGRFAGELPAIDSAFAEASKRDAQRGRRVRQALLAVAFIALAVGVVVLFQSSQAAKRSADEARESADDAQQRLIALMGEQGRQAHLSGRPLEALLYLNRAYQLGADGVGLHYMLSQSVGARDRELAMFSSKDKTQFWGLGYSPDGSLLASSDGSGATYLIDTKTNTIRATLQAEGIVNAVVWSGDSSRLFTVEPNRGITVWDVATQKKVSTIDIVWPAASITSKGELIAAANELGFGVYDGETGRELWKEKRDATIISFSSDGNRMAVALADGTIEVRGRDGEMLSRGSDGHADYINALSWSPDGTRIATAGDDKSVRIWNAKTGALESNIRQRGKAVAVDFSPDGTTIVTGGRFNTTGLYDVATGVERHTLRGHTGFVNLGDFSPDGAELITASQDGTVRLWDARRGTLLSTFAGHTGFVWSAAMDPLGQRFASISWDGTTRIWDRGSRQLLGFVEGGGQHDYSAESNRLITASGKSVRITSLEGDVSKSISNMTDAELSAPASAVAMGRNAAFVGVGKRIVKLDPSSGKKLAEFTLEGPIASMTVHGDWLAVLDRTNHVTLFSSELKKVASHNFGESRRQVMVFSHDGSLLGVAGASTALLSVPDLRVVAKLGESEEDEAAPILSIDFSRDGKRVAVGRRGTRSEVWNIDGSILAVIKSSAPVFAMRFEPAGERVITTAMDAQVALAGAGTGEPQGNLVGHRGGVLGVVFSGDGDLILTASVDRSVRLWDARTLDLLDVFEAHQGAVEQVWFSRDGTKAVSAGSDGVAIYGLDSSRKSRSVLDQFVRCRLDSKLGPTGVVANDESTGDCASPQ